MPWKVTDVMNQKIRFVVRATEPGTNLSALCREFGISRPTGYLWLKRYREANSVAGLEERSRRPRHSPQRTSAAVEARVVALRRRHGWGGKKLQVLLKREEIHLSVSTVHRILRRKGPLGESQAARPAPGRTIRTQRAVANGLQGAVYGFGRSVSSALDPGRLLALFGGVVWIEEHANGSGASLASRDL